MTGWAVFRGAEVLAVFPGGEEARRRATAWARSWAGLTGELEPPVYAVLASVGRAP